MGPPAVFPRSGVSAFHLCLGTISEASVLFLGRGGLECRFVFRLSLYPDTKTTSSHSVPLKAPPDLRRLFTHTHTYAHTRSLR